MEKLINRIKTFFKYRELFFQLVTRDIRLRYRRSVLGYFWSILNPLLTMAVLVIVFSNIFDRRIPYFPIYVIIGHLLFHMMSGSSNSSITSIIGNANLLKKVYIPKYIFTFSSVTSELVTFFFSFCAFFVMLFINKVPFTWNIFLIFIPIVLCYIFCIGLGLFLAQATVFFRDIQHLWSVVSYAWMFLSAIFYPVTILPENVYSFVTRFNPMYFYITIFRHFVIGSVHEDITPLIIRGITASAIMLLIGFVSFTRNKDKFILHI